MSPSILIPLQVFGIGSIISFGIALIIKIMLDAIRYFSKPVDKK